MTNEEFVTLADPHAWLLTADSLHEQALDLRNRQAGAAIVRRSASGETRTWGAAERATVLLAAFALENAIKAFLVFEHPQWVSNGKLSKQLTSHQLLTLRAKSSIIPYRNRFTHVLEFFEGGIESWARYPCALSAQETVDQPALPELVWEDYLRLMGAYGRRMEKLLAQGWKGPHGQFAMWDCKGWKFLQQRGD